MKIGIIGAGHGGTALAILLKGAGHELHLGVRAPHEHASLPGLVGTIAEAAAFGPVVLCAARWQATTRKRGSLWLD